MEMEIEIEQLFTRLRSAGWSVTTQILYGVFWGSRWGAIEMTAMSSDGRTVILRIDHGVGVAETCQCACWLAQICDATEVYLKNADWESAGG